jgi:hypothetical protein
MSKTEVVRPGSFVQEDHWYPKALNSTIHPLVSFFLNLSKRRIIERYCHLRPLVNKEKLEELLSYEPKYYKWSGADLINSTLEGGRKQMVIIENNSCPSGQKSMPLLNENIEDGSYRNLIENTFKPFSEKSKGKKRIEGKLAVIFDKNPMEASGYASVIADVFDEDVYFIPYYNTEDRSHIKIEEDIIHVHFEGTWIPLRAVFRYLTQKPWDRLPVKCKTKIFNPIISCLAGGRNKMMAAKAYDFFNSEIEEFGLKINTPKTIWDIRKAEIPLWVDQLGGQAVIKVPYSNAGQGVYTIISQKELDEFMQQDFEYEKYIVQALIGNYNWSSKTEAGKFYHVGTIPDKNGKAYVYDLRMMVGSTSEGIQPISMYSRRAKVPLADNINEGTDSWDMLGTNLSVKLGENKWGSDTNRLLLTDRRDFNKLGLGLDDLIEAYIQTVLSTIAIDKMGRKLISAKGKLKLKLFTSLNNDKTFLDEILKEKE